MTHPETISVARGYTRTPGPRYEAEGDNSGEGFRKILAPLVAAAIRDNRKLLVDLDGTAGYGTSFLEEVFGGLIREHGHEESTLKKTLKIKSDEEPYLADEIWAYVAEAQNEAARRR
jgi:hypothetical protein